MTVHYVQFDLATGEIYSVGHSQKEVVVPSAVFLDNVALIPSDLIVRFNPEKWRVNLKSKMLEER